MKHVLLNILIGLILFSCDSANENKQNTQMINPSEIHLNEVVHDSLTTDQVEKIKKIHKAFENVYPVSLDETITNFKRDRNPDNEIKIWLNMASAFEKYLDSKKNKLDLNAQKEVFSLILSRSMMSNEEAITNAKLKILSTNEANEVLSYYTENRDPLDVVKK